MSLDGINNNKEQKWLGLDDTSSNPDYQKQLDNKVNSILKGKQTISVTELKKNSLFQNLSEKGLANFDTIAGLDDDDKTFNATELKMLFTLADGKLENDRYHFDAKEENVSNSALNEAEGYEINYLLTNLAEKNSDLKKHITHIDTSKYDTNKPMAERLSSSDVHEVQNAINERLETEYVDKRTGKKMDVLNIMTEFYKFVSENYKEGMSYREIETAFSDATGIPLTNFATFKGTPEFNIGKWKITHEINHNIITNSETGETFNVHNTGWANSTKYTVPNQDGYVAVLYEYNDNKGTRIKFNHNGPEGRENVAPMKATITTNGETKEVNYGTTYRIDPDIYHFIPKE